MNHHRKAIHRHLKSHHPHAVKKAHKLFKFKYPKIAILLISIALAYIIFQNNQVENFITNFDELNYLGTFISGIFLAFGFTAPFSVGYLLVSQPENIFIASVIGGLGATLGDLTIFKAIKFSFMNEFNEIKKSKTFENIKNIVNKRKRLIIKHYLLYIFAGIFIATPLPDEIGVSMLAGLTTIKTKILLIISFILHTIAVFLIILAGS